MMKNLEMITCRKCGEPMPKLRLEKYGYNFCVKCSTEKPLMARTLTFGSGDDVWNDVEIITQDQAQRILELEAQAAGRKPIQMEVLDFDTEDIHTSQSATPVVSRLIEQEEEFDQTSMYVYDADYDDEVDEDEEEEDILDD